MNILPVSKPDLSGNELKYLTECIERGWISSQGDFVLRLENEFAKYTNSKYAVACSSGTTALTLALAALKIGPGDEVIVPEFTMIASAWAVTYTGAKPVFVDCGDDLNIAVKHIERAITPRTKAIVPVHIYGRPCNMPEILKLAHDYNLYVVEDACEAHGAKGINVGDITCYSLFANKIISAGEGGLITTNDERIYKQLIHLRGMAFDDSHSFLHKKLGYNFRMTNLQAAVGLAQLERIDEFLAKRKQIQEWYDVKLKAHTLPRPEGSVLWMYDVVFKNEAIRDKVQYHLARNGIETRVFFKPMSDQPMYKDSFRVIRARDASQMGFYLPTYTQLEQSTVDFISNKVLEALNGQDEIKTNTGNDVG